MHYGRAPLIIIIAVRSITLAIYSQALYQIINGGCELRYWVNLVGVS